MAYTKVAVIGSGAIGGFYGSCLQRGGAEVYFLDTPTDAKHMRESGIRVESEQNPDFNFTLTGVKAFGDPSELPAFDLALVALKTTNNHLLPALLEPAKKFGADVLTLQNGLNVERTIAQTVGDTKVCGGMCFIGVNKLGPGHYKHINAAPITVADYGVGDPAMGVTERMKDIATLFEPAGIKIQMNEDLVAARWIKLLWNIPYNGLCVVLQSPSGPIAESESGRALLKALMEEVRAGARSQGREVPEKLISLFLRTGDNYEYRPSMKLDYDFKRPMEVETMYGEPLRVAQAAGANVPMLEMLYRQLTYLNERNLRA